MSENETYDPSNLDSIIKFGNDLMKYDDTNVSEAFLDLNINKTLNELQQIKENSYDDQRMVQLLRVMNNILFLCHSKDSKLIEKIIDDGLLTIFKNEYDFQVKKAQFNFNILVNINMSLSSLTRITDKAISECVKNEFYNKEMELIESIKAEDLISQNDEKWLSLYNWSVCFFKVSSAWTEIKETLTGLNFVERLINEVKKLDKIISQKEQIISIKSRIIHIIASLLNDEQFDILPISDQIVLMLIDNLKQMISKSKTNQQLLRNTKYYLVFKIDSSNDYTYADSKIKSIITIAVNDTIKQKLFSNGIIQLLIEFLNNGNKHEIDYSCELLCSLCFVEDVVKYLRENEHVLQIIKKLKEESTKDSTKQSCQQILEMTSKNLEKRISSAKKLNIDSQHIMISYNHKYKAECIQINDELNKRGYKTWMDVNSVFSDLHDAMADAIEKSSVVLICYSYEYKISNNCRLEAQYAFKLNKNLIPIKMQPKYDPDGWLGMILASKLYVDFAKDEGNSNIYNNICKQIDNFLKKKDNTTEQRPSSVKVNLTQTDMQTQARPGSHRISSASKHNEKNPKNWSNEEVKNWLRNNNMSTMVNALTTSSGITLKALWEMKQKDYTQFCNTIEKEIEKSKTNVNTIDKLNFYENLQNLFTN